HDGVHQRRTFAADVRAAAGPDPDFDALATTENIVAKQSQPLRIGYGLAKSLDRQGILTANVVVRPFRTADDAGDQHPLEDLVRITLVNAAVLVNVWLTLVGIDHHELRCS